MTRSTDTTRDLFMQLGSNGRVRSVRADAVFRRLRFEQSERAAPPVSVEDAAKLQTKRAKRARKAAEDAKAANQPRAAS